MPAPAPITVAINRDNNPDTLLVFLMAGGAALALRTVHNGKLLPLVGSAVCFGLAFHAKMLLLKALADSWIQRDGTAVRWLPQSGHRRNADGRRLAHTAA